MAHSSRPEPPFPNQQQSKTPGETRAMNPVPDHGEESHHPNPSLLAYASTNGATIAVTGGSPII